MSEPRPANWMDTVPIPKLVLKSSVPLMISTLVSSLYNLVDSMYVSRISEKALTATTIAFPLSLLLFSLSIGLGVGVSSRLSRFLGEGDMKSARDTGLTGLYLALLGMIPFMLIGGFGMPLLFRLLTGDPEVSQMGQAYSRIILLLCAGQFLASLGSRLLQATGLAQLSMATQILGSVTNCILDPIMIFGWLGCPAMGIEGAALATVISQCIAGGSATILYFVKNPALRPSGRLPRLRLDLLKEIFQVGIPVMLTMAMNSLLMILMNRILESISVTAITFYGIYSKLQTFLFMPTNGLGQGIIPVTGYFFGAKNPKKLRLAAAYAIKIGVIFSLVGTAVFLLFPNALMSIYNAGDTLREMGRTGLPIMSLTFVPHAVFMILGNVFNSMGNGMVNMRCSLISGILPLPLLPLLSWAAGPQWCWFAFVIANLLSAGLAVLSYRRQVRTVLAQMK